jgi:hypothetical protein
MSWIRWEIVGLFPPILDRRLDRIGSIDFPRDAIMVILCWLPGGSGEGGSGSDVHVSRFFFDFHLVIFYVPYL